MSKSEWMTKADYINAQHFVDKLTELRTHPDSISDEEFEEFVDLVFKIGQNEAPELGIKHRYEAEAFTRQLIKSLASSRGGDSKEQNSIKEQDKV